MMKNHFVKRVYVFFSSFFILLLHLPFVFAKVKPGQIASSNQLFKIPAIANTAADFPADNFVSTNSIYDSLKLASNGLTKQVFDCAMRGFEYLKAKGKISNYNIISIADFSKSSCKKRFFVIDLKNYKVLFITFRCI